MKGKEKMQHFYFPPFLYNYSPLLGVNRNYYLQVIQTYRNLFQGIALKIFKSNDRQSHTFEKHIDIITIARFGEREYFL
jgi:hypothetical protein